MAFGEASGAISASALNENLRPRHSRFICKAYSNGKSASRRLRGRGHELDSTGLSDGGEAKPGANMDIVYKGGSNPEGGARPAPTKARKVRSARLGFAAKCRRRRKLGKC